jgi:UDP-N-acetylglucosamine:LPS N-acetylglucosamine transferase
VLAAFDVAVVHPGRTLVPELVEARVPTLLVALRADPSHEARGIAAQRRGVALWTSKLDEGLLERVADLSGDAVRTRLASACSELPIEDAAPAVAAASAAVPASPPAPVAGVMTVCAR